MRKLDRNEHSILPIGRIDLKTGDNSHFNVYETWGKNTTYEIWKEYHTSYNKSVYKIIATSGDATISQLGSIEDFAHDQTHRRLFTAVLVDFAKDTELKNFADKYGKSLSGYCYK